MGQAVSAEQLTELVYEKVQKSTLTYTSSSNLHEECCSCSSGVSL